MIVQCKSGPASILASGEVTTFFGHDLDLSVPLGDAQLHLQLCFVDDAAHPGLDVRAAASEQGWRLDLVNFREVTGRGSAEPVLLGEHGEHLIFFHFRVSCWGRSADRAVHYTLFKVPKHDVSWTPDPEDAP